jgi:hypothetical protein
MMLSLTGEQMHLYASSAMMQVSKKSLQEKMSEIAVVKILICLEA